MSLAQNPSTLSQSKVRPLTSLFEGGALADRLTLLLRACLNPIVVRRVSIAFFLLVVLATTVIALVKPEYNWDLAPYVAVSLEDRIADPAVLHATVWNDIKALAPAQQWFELTSLNPYNRDMQASPADFVSQFPMYRVKVGYIETIRLLDRVTDPITATTLIAAFSTLAVGLTMVWWMSRHGCGEAAVLLLPFAMLAGYFNMAILATPDLYMAAFGLVGIYLVVKDRPFAAMPFLFAMFLVRPDGIIFLFALVLSAFVFGYARIASLLVFALSLACYFPIAHAAGHPGWWPHYYFSNIALQNDMVGFSPAFSVIDYLRGLIRGISVSLHHNRWPMLMILMMAGWGILASRGRLTDRRASMMALAIVLCLLGKFATFPLPDDRVYFLFVLAFAMLVLEAWKPRLSFASTAESGHPAR